MSNFINSRKFAFQKGFSLPELVIVVLILAIICAIALPQVLSARRLFGFTGMQRQIAATLNEARQQAMTQRMPITLRYQDSAKATVIYGGSFGVFGAGGNKIETLYGSGITQNEIIYGRPPTVPSAALGDNTNLTNLSGGIVEITFQADGSVVDAGNNPVNSAFFIYSSEYGAKGAFAVSVLGAGGRVKLWRYNQDVNKYAE